MTVHSTNGPQPSIENTDQSPAVPGIGDPALHRYFESLRQREYDRLDRHGHVYLDYTGASIYGVSQLEEVTRFLSHGVLGNPHSVNPSSLASTEMVDETRRSILTYFNADPEQYEVIFTANASGALKLVGEAFPFASGGRYTLTYDNHNSVNGIREFALAAGADVEYVPLTLPDLRIDVDAMQAAIERINPDVPSLLAFPAQSNFSGVQHDLSWVEIAQRQGWTVLLDAAAFVPTNRLDLAAVQPDFVSISFYKMFGYPTGVGCLLGKKESLAKLERPWFGGGTISLVSVQGEGWHRMLKDAAGFEDGTLNYLSIPGVDVGLRFISGVGIERVHDRVAALTQWLIESMSSLRHGNDVSLATIYGPSNVENRGGTIAFNLFDPDGKMLNYRFVELLAAKSLISLRTGCFCNPGAGETAHNLTADDMRRFFTNDEEFSFDQFFQAFDESEKHPSTIRVSVGIATSGADLTRFTRFLRTFIDIPASTIASRAGGLAGMIHTADTA